ncbi:MAG: sensor domain-containing diguanylate cyclase [Candidatus Omnitrophica bacterium]|nr:sensor domain-containing diguanylate cyclase [Candidatus Omnitrophota bacterium]
MPAFAKKILSSNIRLRILLALFFLVFLPVYITFIFKARAFPGLFLFYLINAGIIFYHFNKFSRQKYRLQSLSQDLREKMNILAVWNLQEKKYNLALHQKIERYNMLKDIVEQVNRDPSLDAVSESLLSFTSSLIPNNQGVCVLYLIDNGLAPEAFEAKKENKGPGTRAKQGDIFDYWVLKHRAPLLIEDTGKDFRFDPDKLPKGKDRVVSSLMIAPLVSEHRFLGIMRLDNPQVNFYSQEDLRLLVKICDLGGAALENSQLFEKVQELATHDGLTKLFTKGYFLERLKDECARGSQDKTVNSVLMLDIDSFKDFNDKFGHAAGDIALKRISKAITFSLRKFKTAIISRFGGEEFCVMLTQIAKLEALGVAEELRRQIELKKIPLRNNPQGVTVSIGVASFPEDSQSEDELIQKADKAMYKAKQGGKNRVCGI